MANNGKQWIRLTGIISPPAALSAHTSSVKLKAGFRYHKLAWWADLPTGKSATDCFSKIRLKTKNENRIATLAQHDGVLGLNGPRGAIIYGENLPVPQAGKVCILQPFSYPTEPHFTAMEDTALDVVEEGLWSAELDNVSLATAPSNMEVVALVEPLREVPEAIRNITRLERWEVLTPPVGGTSIDLDNLIKLSGRVMSLHIFNSTNSQPVTRVEIKIDGEEKFDRYKYENDQDLLEAGKSPVADRFDILPTIHGKGSDAWDADRWNNFAMKLHFGAAATGTVAIVARTWGARR